MYGKKYGCMTATTISVSAARVARRHYRSTRYMALSGAVTRQLTDDRSAVRSASTSATRAWRAATSSIKLLTCAW